MLLQPLQRHHQSFVDLCRRHLLGKEIAILASRLVTLCRREFEPHECPHVVLRYTIATVVTVAETVLGVVGAGWTPCLGPVLGGLFMLAGAQETVWSGMFLLSFYSLGLAIPFLISALALDWFLGAFSRIRRFLPMVEKASGVLLIAVGVLLLTGSFTILNEYLSRFTPEWIFQRI